MSVKARDCNGKASSTREVWAKENITRDLHSKMKHGDDDQSDGGIRNSKVGK